MTEHGLGRTPSPPDERDYKMSRFFDAIDADPERAALAKLLATHWVAHVVKDWAVEASKKLAATPTPTPTPTPDPTPSPPAPTGAVEWKLARAYDQGQTPHCVAYASTHYGIADPVNDAWNQAYAEDFYKACKILDGEPDAQNGTTVRTAAKILKNRKRIAAYLFASSEADVRRWVLEHGTVIIGISWYADMKTPDAKGVVTVSGANAGGHSILIVGFDPATSLYKVRNSWGDSWGARGFFYLHAADLANLLADNGEAMAATELPL